MQFENRLPDERVNYSTEHPLREFAWLVLGVLGTVAALTTVIAFSAGRIAQRVPFALENEFAAGITAQWESTAHDPGGAAAQTALRAIAAKLAPVMALPPDMVLHVHYDEKGVPNAFATLGGNIVVYRGLLQRLDSEDAVAMVLAHEIAHAKLRHVAAGLGRSVAVGMTLSLMSVGMGRNVAGTAIQTAGNLPLLKYTREQEAAADAEAISALAAVYGHVGGASDTFAVLGRIAPDRFHAVTLLRSHPLTADRIAQATALARERHWPTDGERTPLAPALARLHTPAVATP